MQSYSTPLKACRGREFALRLALISRHVLSCSKVSILTFFVHRGAFQTFHASIQTKVARMHKYLPALSWAWYLCERVPEGVGDRSCVCQSLLGIDCGVPFFLRPKYTPPLFCSFAIQQPGIPFSGKSFAQSAQDHLLGKRGIWRMVYMIFGAKCYHSYPQSETKFDRRNCWAFCA